MLGVVLRSVQLLECGLVALVHEEQLALDEHLVDQLVEQLAPEGEGDGLVAHLEQRLLAELVHPHVQRQQDVVLRLEVVVERRLGDAEALGDLAQAGAVEALLGEEVESHIEDALAGVGLYGGGRGDGAVAVVVFVAGLDGVGGGLFDGGQVDGVEGVFEPWPGSVTLSMSRWSSALVWVISFGLPKNLLDDR